MCYAHFIRLLKGVEVSRKHDNFVRLAEARVNKALEAIRLVGNLSNRSNYEYSDAESRAILAAINSAVSDLRAQFNRATDEESKAFKFTKAVIERTMN